MPKSEFILVLPIFQNQKMDPLDVPFQKADTFPGVLLRMVRKITTHPWEPTVQGQAGGGQGWGAEPGVRAELRARTPSPVRLWSCCRVDAYDVRVSHTCPFTRQWPLHAELCTLFYGLAYETVPCQELRPQPGHHHPTDTSLAHGPSACMSGASSFFPAV